MAKRTRQVITVGGAVVVVIAGAVIWATSASSSPGYRTATAGPASVTATLDTTGTIEPVQNATVSFPSGGQVASVPVAVGQQVSAGQTLAQLDTTSLQNQVASAQSTLASAQAKLAADQSGQASSSSGGRATPALYVTASSAPSDLEAEQNAVISAQHQVDLDLTAASAAVAAQKKACQAIVDPAPQQDSQQQDQKQQSPSQSDVDACTTAIQQAQDAQHTTATDEQKLADAENALSETLAKNAAAQRTEPAPPSSSGKTPSSQIPSSKSPSSQNLPSKSSTGKSSAGGGTSSGPASAEQLAADQAAIDSANAQVAVAQQSLAAATLVSPIAGTVGQIDFTQGQAASTAQHIVVFGPGSNQVTTAVSDTQAGQIKPGQQVSVTPDGSGKPINGQVTSIGLLASTTSSGSPSYPVTISLPSGGDLFPGATAAVSIVTSTANAAVTVPTSAVHRVGANAFVTTLSGGKTLEKRVTAGVVGASVTQIEAGLNAGEQVVLADLSAPLPTSGTTGPRGFGGGRAVPRRAG
ncbi:efflux RND transporter periplasmic adaptor subunit [Amycolatopsis alkalitolerans]|uniref:HlyD family efflux transporter periplasmic adaptor subunit n=1 Tax=Amycolatopsis alkalitolerans TaxID=2547244 RepID=A0A5C4LU77_9PSEU|nr:biotin/lipoyl-binding protein [Amycolatopsis alkalitolerans]TNC21638.1 HlyD family efflux transporter periplasmic adaptor subunit [Amycolatopsis alkalitolerans]